MDAGTAADLLARTFKSIGLRSSFAPLVILLGHGASSVNNPFFSAYNCGACSGKDSSPNARFFAQLANDRDVRARLATLHGIEIPASTWFVAGKHDTTADRIELFELTAVPATHTDAVLDAQQMADRAVHTNALERCRRFLLAANVETPQQALRHVRTRAADFAEARPELNHASNAAVVVGRRGLTKGRFYGLLFKMDNVREGEREERKKEREREGEERTREKKKKERRERARAKSQVFYLDRRVFMPSYDPSVDDDKGTYLEGVLAPALVVCSGINLELVTAIGD